MESNYLIYLSVVLIALVINVIAIRSTAYKGEKLTCDNYIVNSYLYFVLAVLIVILTLLMNVKFQVLERIAPLFASFIGSIIFLIVIMTLIYYFKSLNPSKSKVEIHIVWTLIFVVLSLILYPFVLLTNMSNTMNYVLGIVLAIIVVTAYLGINHGDFIVRFDWAKYLYGALIASIALTFILSITGSYTQHINVVLTYGVLLIFILLLISYNKRLIQNSKKCLEDNNPNYLDESLGLFTKIMNVFARVAKLMGKIRR